MAAACLCMCVYFDISTTRQVQGKLLAPATDKTTSGTRMVELMGGENTEGRRGRRENSLALQEGAERKKENTGGE